MCEMCEKRFKSPEFVHKHIFNKHGEELDKKFNQHRFDAMLKENYMNDPNKFIHTYQSSSYSQGGYNRDRRDYRRRDYHSYREGGDDRRRKEYIDYDDPNTHASKMNPERQLVSYDDLF